jgi:hypothetical protein
VSTNWHFQVDSSPGTLWLAIASYKLPGERWELHTQSVEDLRRMSAQIDSDPPSIMGAFAQDVRMRAGSVLVRCSVPYWFVLSSIAAGAVAPWLSWRFSLRALFVAITMAALLIGLTAASIE